MGVGAVMIGIGFIVASASTGLAAGGSPEPSLQDLCDALVATEAARVDADPLDPTVLDPSDFDPAVIEAHTALIEEAAGACEWPGVEVEASEYEYLGLEGEVLSEETWVFQLTNAGSEYHELVIFEVSEVAEGMSTREILEDPYWQEYLTRRGSASAPPAQTASTAIELTLGRWAAVCFIPVGTTSATLSEMLETGEIPEGAEDLHWMHDQFAEFYVD